MVRRINALLYQYHEVVGGGGERGGKGKVLMSTSSTCLDQSCHGDNVLIIDKGDA